MTPLALITAAILACRPAMPRAEADRYAAIVARADVDPLTIVALVDRETGWVSRAFSSDGRYLGLGQVAWRFRPACARGRATVHRSRCATERRRLLDGAYNLHAVLEIIDEWRTTCRTITGQWATEAGWLAAYEGANRPPDRACALERDSTGRWSPLSLPRVVVEIQDRSQALRRQLQ